MRLPTATVLTACALSAALLVAGRAGDGAKYTMPGPDAVFPAAQGRVLFADPLTDLSDTGADPESDADPESGADLDRGLAPDAVGPETVPEIPDPPDGGGLVPDGPDESDALDPSDPVFGSPVDAVLG
ncbi:hypothetical protein OG802_30655 [Streptomyces sp. NBC_00704]|uniref:hypothetical protein n=1 Tax=Streptomyces sp. NBC_00704 TaxID=2975809 RepID=UPI002E36A31D|nr:hypothetical protein [Streptomyces sp. NBC_00704]